MPRQRDAINDLCNQIGDRIRNRASLKEYRPLANQLMRALDDKYRLYGIPRAVLDKACQTLLLCKEYRGESDEAEEDLKEFLIIQINRQLDRLKRVQAELRRNKTTYKLRGVVEEYISENLDTKGKVFDALKQIISPHLKKVAVADSVRFFNPQQPMRGIEGIQDFFYSLPEDISCFDGVVLDLLGQKDLIPVALVTYQNEYWVKHLAIEVDANKHSTAIHFNPQNVNVREDFIQAAEIARKVAYSFLASKGKKPDREDFYVSITLPKWLETFDRLEGRSAELPIALAIVGRFLEFDYPPGSIASGHFDVGTPQEYLQKELREPYKDIPPLQPFENPDSLQGKIISAIEEGYRRFIYPRDSQLDSGRFASEIALAGVIRFEDAVDAYFGDQWRAWKNEHLSRGWLRPAIFIDRQDAIKDCLDTVCNNAITILYGLSGVGKTLLAQQLRDGIKAQFNDTEIISVRELGSHNTPLHFYRRLASFLARQGYGRLSAALNNQDAHLTDARNSRLIEIAVSDLTKEPCLLVIDNVETVLDSDRRMAIEWRPFFELLINTKLNCSKVILITNTEIQSEFILEKAELKEIDGFDLDEARAFLQQLEDRHLPHESGYERICHDKIFDGNLYPVTQGNPTALLYVFAFHHYTRIPYGEMLAQRESYLYSERSLKIENNILSINHLLRALFNKLNDEYRELLLRFSVYRHPVPGRALQYMNKHQWYYATQEMEALFLIERQGQLYQLYPLAKDLAHIKLRNNKGEYSQSHNQAAKFYIRERGCLEGNTYLLDEAIYHYDEAGNQRRVNELSITHPSLRRAEKARKRSDFHLAVDQYEKYIGDVRDWVSSKTLSDYAYCLEKTGDRRKAEQLYKEAISAGNTVAEGRLACLYLDAASRLENMSGPKSTDSTEPEFDDWDALMDKALRHYEAAISKRCEDYQFYLAFYESFHSYDPSKAASTYKGALQNLRGSHTYHGRAQFFIGVAKYHEQNGEMDEVLSTLTQAIEGEFAVPSYEHIYIKVADIYINRFDDYGKAIDVLLTGTRNTQRNTERYRGRVELKLAGIYLDQHDYPEARKWMERSIRISPGNPNTLLRLAELIIDEAKGYTDYVKGSELRDKKYGEALVYLRKAWCLAHTGEARRARILKALNRIYSVTPILSECMSFAKWYLEPKIRTQPLEGPKKLLRGSASDHWKYIAHEQYFKGGQAVLSDTDIEKHFKALRGDTSEDLYDLLKIFGKSEFPEAKARKRFVSILIDRLHSPNDSLLLKSCIIATLGRLQAREAVVPLSLFLQKEDEKASCLHFPAAWALTVIATPECLPVFRQALKHSHDPLVQICAVYSLGALSDDMAFEDLVGLFERESEDINAQLVIISSLGKLNNLGARGFIERKFDEGEGLVKLAAAAVLAESGDVEALEFVMRYLGRGTFHPEDRYAYAIATFALASYLLWENHSYLDRSHQALELLYTMAFSSPDRDASLLARKALAKACSRDEHLEYLANSSLLADNRTKAEFVNLLGDLGGAHTVLILKRFLYDNKANVQDAAIKALYKLRPFGVLPILEEFADQVLTFAIRQQVADIIKNLGGECAQVQQCKAWPSSRRSQCPMIAEPEKDFCSRHLNRPRKMRIYQLAKALGISWQKVVDTAQAEGINVKVPANTITEDQAEVIKNKLLLRTDAEMPPLTGMNS